MPDDFADLWAFVTGLLRRISPGGSLDRHWLAQERNRFKNLWEVARQQAEYDPRPPAGELAGYLNAARLASAEHPYPAILPGTVLPPLSQVYVRQQAQLQQAGESGKSLNKTAWDRRPAEDIIQGTVPMTWLLGGPGAGKSSLLRMIVIRLARELLSGGGKKPLPRRSTHPGVIQTTSSKDDEPRARPLFPVYVPAQALTQPGSFTQQLAHAVAAQLKGYDYVPPSDRLFRGPPLPGAQWLILIDGLDEISDVDERLRVLKTLMANKKYCYRFVIGSRPLPDSELAILDEAVDPAREESGSAGRYELLPLDVSVLPTFVRGWMDAAHVPEPAPAVAAFMYQVNGGRLRELVRIPLMATILCQLHAADPTHPLPTGRYTAYQRFYELLCDRFYDPSTTGINHQLHTQLQRYGAQSSAAIDSLPNRLLTALGQVAFGGEASAPVAVRWSRSGRA
ncbi:hypothetical protein [Nonomuraea longicatena]|uniref:Nephrocystin 3-like N-terminal domain-containing protein n=1 Tax=Nonomuraea longicatena TaxID=83682 RepID=A0ABP4BUU4_9ACTN